MFMGIVLVALGAILTFAGEFPVSEGCREIF